MNRFAFFLAIPLCFLVTTGARAQEKVNEQVLKELAELRAELKALKAEIAKLKGNDDTLIPTISDYDKKWVRNLTNDFLSAMLKGGQVTPFVRKGWELPIAHDPNCIVRQTSSTESSNYSGPWRASIASIFEKYQIESEEVAPTKDEVVIRGKLTGNTRSMPKTEDYAGNFGHFRKTVLEAGEPGPRTGTFMLRVTKEKDSSRWTISYLTLSVDKLKKDVEKE